MLLEKEKALLFPVSSVVWCPASKIFKVWMLSVRMKHLINCFTSQHGIVSNEDYLPKANFPASCTEVLLFHAGLALHCSCILRPIHPTKYHCKYCRGPFISRWCNFPCTLIIFSVRMHAIRNYVSGRNCFLSEAATCCQGNCFEFEYRS